MKFPSLDATEAWYKSEAYQAVLPIFLGVARCQFVIVDGEWDAALDARM